MKVIETVIAGLEIARPRRHRNLSVFALLADTDGPRGYLTLDEALARGLVRVTEVSEGGHVPELHLENAGERSVLLLDGEELVGAKQNRVLNLSILAPAKQTIVIPVSCVEAGRWRNQGRDFEAADRAHYAGGRAAKMRSVSESLYASGRPLSDQGEVWDGIERKSRRLGIDSPTAAMADLFEGHAASIEDYVEAFGAEPRQVGALFAVDGHIAGIDLFDHPETLAAMLPKLVRSYALDCLEPREPAVEGGPQADEAAARAFLDAIAGAEPRLFESAGVGYDARLEAPGLVAGALLVEDRLVHLAGFRVSRDGSAQPAGLSRASVRRSGRAG